MSEHSVIVWDLETIPDLAAARRLFDLGDAGDAQVREVLGSGFPKHPLQKIACIGALVASRQPEGWRVDALQHPTLESDLSCGPRTPPVGVGAAGPVVRAIR